MEKEEYLVGNGRKEERLRHGLLGLQQGSGLTHLPSHVPLSC